MHNIRLLYRDSQQNNKIYSSYLLLSLGSIELFSDCARDKSRYSK